MDTYIIRKAYPLPGSEIEITSENLTYSELMKSYSGCQSESIKNNDKIHRKCVKIANLIRDIEKLNIK